MTFNFLCGVSSREFYQQDPELREETGQELLLRLLVSEQ